jgi:hypothetical protein
MVRSRSDDGEWKKADRTYMTAFEKLGNKGWNWETLKTYYKKVERLLPPNVKDGVATFDVREHGLEGALYFVILLRIYRSCFRSAGGVISSASRPRKAFCW